MLLDALRSAAHDLIDRRNFRDLDLLLSRIVLTAVETVPGADAGGISTTTDGLLGSQNPTSGVISKLDQLQSELREGPCISAIDQLPSDGLVIVDDLAGDDAARWPRFAPQAVEQGYRSMVSVQLTREPNLRAALNLYAAEPEAFDADARLTAALFGLQAAALLFGADTARHLQHAVDSRDVIGQAKGILMERFTVTGDQAFQMMVTSSQETNIKLVEVASWLVGEADQRQPPRGHHHGL
ncbi:GAF and ANTAR domain-containing protein [Actinomycetospora aeridis]|uniref:GAF and ANTAR domain-containing protein n=1 Tax=Actinomycetospora aeridis TaxID=3129231 RepID=A0ABU8NBD0_9PSEU